MTHSSAEDAMRALNDGGGRGTAICWNDASSGIAIRLAALTPFGGVLREWEGRSREFLQSLIDDTIHADAGPVHCRRDGSAAELHGS